MTKKKLLKLPQKEFEIIQELADEYCNGNTTLWIRFAAVSKKPTKKELAKCLNY